MLKLFNRHQLLEWDQVTLKSGVTTAALVNNVATNLHNSLLRRINPDQPIYLFCGTGNNGADGLQLAQKLTASGFDCKTFALPNQKSVLNLNLIQQLDGVEPIDENIFRLKIPTNGVIIDALYGIGLNKELSGLTKELVLHLNKLTAYKVAIDIPSGLFSTKPSQIAFKANLTLTVEKPKIAFFLADGHKYVGNWQIVSAGLDEGFERATFSNFYRQLKKMLF